MKITGFYNQVTPNQWLRLRQRDECIAHYKSIAYVWHDRFDDIVAAEKSAFLSALRMYNSLVQRYHNKNVLREWFAYELKYMREWFYANDLPLYHIHRCVGEIPWALISYHMHLNMTGLPSFGKWQVS